MPFVCVLIIRGKYVEFVYYRLLHDGSHSCSFDKQTWPYTKKDEADVIISQLKCCVTYKCLLVMCVLDKFFTFNLKQGCMKPEFVSLFIPCTLYLHFMALLSESNIPIFLFMEVWMKKLHLHLLDTPQEGQAILGNKQRLCLLYFRNFIYTVYVNLASQTQSWVFFLLLDISSDREWLCLGERFTVGSCRDRRKLL